MRRTARFYLRQLRSLSISAVGIATAFVALAGVTSPMSGADTLTLVQLRADAEKIAPLHQKKQPSSAGDWLASHPERGQTFDQYRRSNPNRPSKIRTTLYVQPIGDFTVAQKQLVADTAELLSRFYHVRTKVLERIGLDVIPGEARRGSRGGLQILTTSVLENVLKPRRPRDAVAVLCLTTADLWPGPGWNFVFGQASLSERVGVWSLARYGKLDGTEEEARQFRRRMFKVAVHETGHMFGITHCTAYECGMNGSNHLEEMDNRPFSFCPECVEKVWWVCHADPVKRYRLLADFAKRQGLQAEAAFWQESAERLKEPSKAQGPMS
jgi:archaemetzincin